MEGTKGKIALMVRGCGYPRVVIAANQERSATGRATCKIAMTKDIPASVNAGAFPVPHGKDAIVLSTWKKTELLRADHRTSG